MARLLPSAEPSPPRPGLCCLRLVAFGVPEAALTRRSGDQGIGFYLNGKIIYLFQKHSKCYNPQIPLSLVWALHVYRPIVPLLLEHSQASCPRPLGSLLLSRTAEMLPASLPPPPGPCVPLSSYVEYVYPDFSCNGKYCIFENEFFFWSFI